MMPAILFGVVFFFRNFDTQSRLSDPNTLLALSMVWTLSSAFQFSKVVMSILRLSLVVIHIHSLIE